MFGYNFPLITCFECDMPTDPAEIHNGQYNQPLCPECYENEENENER